VRYWELLTDLTLPEIKLLKDSGRNPRDIKLDLCERIASDYHGQQAGRAAKEAWLRDISQGHIPENQETSSSTEKRLDKILASSGLAQSVTAADRLIMADAVEVFLGTDKSKRSARFGASARNGDIFCARRQAVEARHRRVDRRAGL